METLLHSKIKQEGIKQVEGYLKLDKIKNIPKLRSFLLIGSKNGGGVFGDFIDIV